MEDELDSIPAVEVDESKMGVCGTMGWRATQGLTSTCLPSTMSGVAYLFVDRVSVWVDRRQ
jgi:hypothetical protein